MEVSAKTVYSQMSSLEDFSGRFGKEKDNILHAIKKWAQYPYKDPSTEYIVCLVRRGSALFHQAVESYENQWHSDEKPQLITDCAYLGLSKVYAESYIQRGRFPRTYINDDVLLHGRSVERLVRRMERSVYREITGCGYETGFEEVRTAFSESIVINILACAKREVLLGSRYLQRMKPWLILDDSGMHEFSAVLSSYFMDIGQTYAPYVVSDAVKTVPDGDLIHTQYLNRDAYCWVYHGVEHDRMTFAFAVRFLRMGKGTSTFLATPIVFLPNLSDEETDDLESFVCEQLDSMDRGVIHGLRKRIGSQMYNELLTMYIAHIVLTDCERRNGLMPDPVSRQKDLSRIAENFFGCNGQYSAAETEAFIARILRDAENRSFQELTHFLNRRPFKLDFGSFIEGERHLKHDEIAYELEGMFYSLAVRDERNAYHGRLEGQERISLYRIFRIFFRQFTIDGSDLPHMLAIMCGMMDYGVFGVSSNPPAGMKVVGFSEFLKAGELSLALYTIRIFMYLPLFINLRSECKARGRLSKFEDMLGEFFEYKRLNPGDAVERDLFSDRDFCDSMVFLRYTERYGQEPLDWWGQYFPLVHNPYPDDDNFDKYFGKQMDIAHDAFNYFWR